MPDPYKLPCPVCGETYPTDYRATGRRLWKRWFVGCWECHYCGKSRPTLSWAIWKWNRIRRVE